MKTIELDPVTAKYVEEVLTAAAEAQRQAAAPFMPRIEAAVQLFIRRAELPGNWALSDDGKSITQPGEQ